MPTYVQARGSDTWHFCKNCSRYPGNPEKKQSTRPTSGELCNECKSKEKAGNCK